MTTDDEDRPTWPDNRKVIRRDELLRLIEENGGPWGLDLRGVTFVGEAPGSTDNPIDLSPRALRPLAEADTKKHGDLGTPWLRGAGIELYGAQLDGAVFNGARLQEAVLWRASLQGAKLWDAQLQRAHLWDADLRGASLAGARLEGAMLFRSRFAGCTLVDADLSKAYLGLAHVERVDMYDVATLDGAQWYGAFLDHTRIKRDRLGKAIGDEIEAHDKKTVQAYRQASEAYLLLKNNFNQIGRYDDASWAYVKEQQMEKMAHYWQWRSHGWQVWRGWGSLRRWLRNWAYELATGYGERPWNPVAWGGVIVLGFALGFTRAVGNFWDALIYSLATFATFNLADTGPTGRGADVASSVEALLGIAVLALVVFTLGNKMSRG